MPTWFLRSAERFVLVLDVFGIPASEVQLLGKVGFEGRDTSLDRSSTILESRRSREACHAHQNQTTFVRASYVVQQFTYHHKPWSKQHVDTAIKYLIAGQLSKPRSVGNQYPDFCCDVKIGNAFMTCQNLTDINTYCKRDWNMARIQNRRDDLSSVRNVAKFCQVYSCMNRPSRGARKESTMTRLTLPSTEV